MKPAIINGACRLIGHCQECRMSIEWRSLVGTPEICPHGITKESLSNPDGLGSIVEKLTKPFALLFPCYDENKQLKPTSRCFKNKQKLNALTATQKQTK